MLTRRLILVSGLAASLAPVSHAAVRLRRNAAEIEAQLQGGRLGVCWLGPGGGTWTGHRESERFMMCSTFKVFLAAATMNLAARSHFSMSDEIAISREDLVPYAPLVEQHVDRVMTREALCEAAVTLSDNAAANLLLRDLGGPARLTEFMRAIGDTITRMDRNEPALNRRESWDDIRDTSTPWAFAQSLRKVLFGGVLPSASARRLSDWMRYSPTGAGRIRAGLPREWDAGDKSGTNGDDGFVNDAAFFRSPKGMLHTLVVFVDAPNASMERREAAIAAVARLAAISVMS